MTIYPSARVSLLTVDTDGLTYLVTDDHRVGIFQNDIKKP